MFLVLTVLAVSSDWSAAAQGTGPAARRTPLDSSPVSASCQAGIDHFYPAADAAPSDVDAELSLARALAACRQYSEAIAACRRAFAAHPGDRDLQLQIARLLAWDHRYDDSISALRALLKHQPDDREALEGAWRVRKSGQENRRTQS